jgi:hypothetical protein
MGVKLGRQKQRDEYKLRIFENRMQKRLFGPKRNEVTGEWKKLHKGELSDLLG